MYLPPVVLVALLQVTGPMSGSHVDALHVPAPMILAAEPIAAPAEAKSPESIADMVPVVTESKQTTAKPETPPSGSVGEMPLFPDPPRSQMPTAKKRAPLNPRDRLAAQIQERSGQRPDRGSGDLPPVVEDVSSPNFDRYSERTSGRGPEQLLPSSQRISQTEEQINRAIVETDDEVPISARTSGALVMLRVPKIDPKTGEAVLGPNGEPVMVKLRPGQYVREGQLLGKIDDATDQARVISAEASLAVAEAEAAKMIEIDFAYASYKVAYAEVKKNELLNEGIPNSVPHMLVLEAELRKVQALKQWEKAKYDIQQIRPREVEVKKQEMNVALELLDQRKLYSPIDGVVVDVRAAEGEYFKEGEKLIRVIRMDKLRVRGRVDSKRLLQRDVDRRLVTVTPINGDSKQQFRGKVTFASPELATDAHFDIHVEVDNRMENGYWLLSTGEFVVLTIHLDKFAE